MRQSVIRQVCKVQISDVKDDSITFIQQASVVRRAAFPHAIAAIERLSTQSKFEIVHSEKGGPEQDQLFCFDFLYE